MAYAIRYHSPLHAGMLCEMEGRALAKITAAQDEADERREAYWDTPEEARPPQSALPPATYPYFERVGAHGAHDWVKGGFPHETLLYTEDGKIRRA